MTTTVAINGFGRIGRMVLRAMIERDVTDLRVTRINDLAPAETLANLLKYDSVHGRLRADVDVNGNVITVDGNPIEVSAEHQPGALPWQDIDMVFECTGRFKSRDQAAAHLGAGAKRVLISAPGKDVDRTVVYGVNHTDLTAQDVIVSNASCTTNCLAPLALVLDRECGIKSGYMTTVHAFTGDQPTHDRDHADPYRARAASLSMVPTTTGAAKAISLVLPQLEGRLEGSAIRVPTPNVSLVDLSFIPQRKTSVAAINAAVRAAAEGPLTGILSYESDPMVSIDFNHDSHSSCFAPAQTTVTPGGLVRVLSWYDNEWGFSNRMIDTARVMAAFLDRQGGKSGAMDDATEAVAALPEGIAAQ